MSSNLFTPSLRYTNKDTCNSAWTFIDGQNVSDIEVPQFIKNLFTSFDDSRYGKMGKDLIEGFACTQPNTAGYDFSSVNTHTRNLDSDSFNVDGIQCATGYGGTVVASVCTTDGVYTVSGCGRKTCADPEGTGTSTAHECSGDDNYLKATPESVNCSGDQCTDTDCCTVEPQQNTCAADVCGAGWTPKQNQELAPGTVASEANCCDAVTVVGKCSGNDDTGTDFTCTDNWTPKPTSDSIDLPTGGEATRRAACCVPPDNTCATVFEGATTGKDQPCNLNDPDSAGWTKGDFKDDPLWGKYDTGKDNSSLTDEQATAIEVFITSNEGKTDSYTPAQMNKDVWGKCCKKAECTDVGWTTISITDPTGSWIAWSESLGCGSQGLDPSSNP